MNKILFFTILLSLKLMATELLVGTNYTVPPYFIKEQNSGIELDIIKEIFYDRNVTPVYISSERNIKLFENNKIDAAATVNENSTLQGFYSDVYITYQNCFISLEESNITINSLQDAKNYSLLAFQNATKYLGKEFAEFTTTIKNYREKSNQLSQIMLLYTKRVDLILSDINIFKYYKEQSSVDTTKNVKYHCIFPQTEYKIVFQDKSTKEIFNERLKTIKTNGRYTQIVNKYIK